MKEKNVSNKELAALTGLHVKTIREIRAGTVNPRYSSLRRIIKCLKTQNG
nr:MAG TPA: putative transcriptional regulator [Caudoviricetes sp.]